MTIRAVLVDDEQPARARLRQLLAQVADVVIVGEAGDAIEARRTIAATRPDVVFLDIEMPEVSGTVLAQSLPEPRPFIVFATAFDQYAVDAFAVDATDYLVKPITRARLAGTLARVRERLSGRSDLERDLAAASAAQAALLPRTMPLMPGFDAAALTRPARGVSGDFFIAQALTDERVALALGDVAGKGLPAGLVASSLQARIEAVARYGAGSATDLVTAVNRTLCVTSDGARFATLTYLEVNAPTGDVTLINAGHLPALLVSRDAATRSFTSTGPALGLLPDATFPAHHVTMQDGDMLVLMSDGVTEAFSAEGEEYGDARLLAVVMAQGASSAAVVCQAIVDDVRRHAPGVPGDDLTVLVLRRFTGSPVHGFTGSRVHRFTGSRVHGFTGSNSHGST
jgi:sigma-B regulation protein RsbU (phosphoserine phosphatase)